MATAIITVNGDSSPLEWSSSAFGTTEHWDNIVNGNTGPGLIANISFTGTNQQETFFLENSPSNTGTITQIETHSTVKNVLSQSPAPTFSIDIINNHGDSIVGNKQTIVLPDQDNTAVVNVNKFKNLLLTKNQFDSSRLRFTSLFGFFGSISNIYIQLTYTRSLTENRGTTTQVNTPLGRSTKLVVANGDTSTAYQINDLSTDPASPYPITINASKQGVFSNPYNNVISVDKTSLVIWLPPYQAFLWRYKTENEWTIWSPFTSVGYTNSFDKYALLSNLDTNTSTETNTDEGATITNSIQSSDATEGNITGFPGMN